MPLTAPLWKVRCAKQEGACPQQEQVVPLTAFLMQVQCARQQKELWVGKASGATNSTSDAGAAHPATGGASGPG